MDRRQLIKGTIATSVLAFAGVSGYQYFLQNQLDDSQFADRQFLTKDDQLVLSVLIPIFYGEAFLDSLPPTETVMTNIDNAISRLPLRVQNETRDLFNILASGVGRVLIANVWLNWQQASKASLHKFLLEWRDAHTELLQVAYKGLHKLILGSVYAEANTWSSIGYSGPPSIR